jgi:hypothetical protein
MAGIDNLWRCLDTRGSRLTTEWSRRDVGRRWRPRDSSFVAGVDMKLDEPTLAVPQFGQARSGDQGLDA